jgi:hypothetical protein
VSDEDESIVQRPREAYDIAKLQQETEFERFLEHPLTQALEALTGAFALGTKRAGFAAGRIAQALIKGKMYEQCAEEWRELREAGKIPENLGETEHGLYTWAELMMIIDDECPDRERLDALKAAFYAVNKVKQSDEEVIVQYQLWQVAKELKSGDILLLRSMYARVNGTVGSHYQEWVTGMLKSSGLMIPELLERHEKRLCEFSLMTPRFAVAGDSQLGYERSGINVTNNRLSQLGVRLCQNIGKYKIDLANAQKPK